MPPTRSTIPSRNCILYTYGRNSPRRPHTSPADPPSDHEIPPFPMLTMRAHSIESTVSDNPPTVSALIRSIPQDGNKKRAKPDTKDTKGVRPDTSNVLEQCMEQLRNVRNYLVSTWILTFCT